MDSSRKKRLWLPSSSSFSWLLVSGQGIRTAVVLLLCIAYRGTCATKADPIPSPDRASVGRDGRWFGRRIGGAEFGSEVSDGVIDHRDLDGRIVGGAPINATTRPFLPFQVLIEIVKNNGQYYCGGTLIDRQFVVTASHCVLNSSVLVVPPAAITVYVGALRFKAGRKVSVQQVWSHPNFTFFENDVTLLKLSTSLPISEFVAPIKISASDSPLSEGSDLAITGWGTTSETSGSSVVDLRGATVNYLPNGCGLYTGPPNGNYVPRLMICAGCPVGAVDTCHGDSGGPATTSSSSNGCPILVGITSFGNGCARAQFPGVYTRASAVVGWLESKAGRVFRSSYPIKPTTNCETCAGWNRGLCGLIPPFNTTICQREAWMASTFAFRLKSCVRVPSPGVGRNLPVEASFNPTTFLSFTPTGTVYFLRGSNNGGGSTLTLGGVQVSVPFSGTVESRQGTQPRIGFWTYTWTPEISSPNRTCSNFYAYAAAFVSTDNRSVQVSLAVRQP